MAKQPKLKTYVIIVSRFYPGTHPLKGQHTNFPELIISDDKTQTVRPKYEKWAKRAKEVQEGKAVISLRYWDGRPYGKGVSQIEILQLNYIDVQKVHIYHVRRSDYVQQVNTGPHTLIFVGDSIKPLQHPFKFAARDGLTMPAFLGWFKKPIENAAIIHFTKFLY